MTEKKLQAMCEKYLNTNKVKYFHINDAIYNAFNSKRLPLPDWLRFVVLGEIAGFPDLVIFFKTGKYLCVELKTDKGKQSPKQKLFEKAVGSDNYKVIRSIKTFKDAVDPLIKEQKEL